MSKFPISDKLINEAITSRIDAALTARGRDLDWLAGEVGVSTHRLLTDFTEGVSYAFLWDISEVLGVSTGWLAVGR